MRPRGPGNEDEGNQEGNFNVLRRKFWFEEVK